VTDGFGLVGSRRVASLAFLDLDRSYYRTPGGGWMVRGLVRHPGSVVIVPWDGERVHLIRQYRAAAGGALLELPAGKLDAAGEPPEQTAIRETVEETGLRPGRLSLLHTAYTSPGFTDEFTRIYLAEDLRPVAADPKGAEEHAAEVVALTLAEVEQTLDDGSIVDATTLVGLYALLRRLRR
jgi:ADP-ribose pyrophosphatase